MSMEQRLTPQLIQSMAILQKPVADLEAHIAEALESNAALELAEPEPEEAAHGPPSGDLDRNGSETVDAFARLDRFARDQNLDQEERIRHLHHPKHAAGERDAKMDAMANTASRAINLNDFLLEQWTLLEHDTEVRRAGEALINQLDPDGYLRLRFDEVAKTVRPALSVESVEEAFARIQRLEPAGVGARDTIECLLLQLDRLPGDNRIERTLIEKHLIDIAHNRLPAVAKATGYSIGEINEAINAMRSTLILHPGYLIGDRSVPRIRPDVIVEYAETGGGLTVRLARGNAPELRISEEVLAMAKSKANRKDVRAFAKQHVESAAALIDAVTFRRGRLMEVARSICEKQSEFFEVGPSGLTILRMSDLAVELDCDPSTISRTVAEKYMQSPRGIYPLRYFFTGGTEDADGHTTSWDSVKNRVKELVEAEDAKKPLNDDQVAAKLKEEGVVISRRTVAKYRQQFQIPSARQRRVF